MSYTIKYTCPIILEIIVLSELNNFRDRKILNQNHQVFYQFTDETVTQRDLPKVAWLISITRNRAEVC